MAAAAIALRRLYQQRISQNPFATPEEVVAWLGGVQAQDFAGAKWALGLRMENGTDAVVEGAFNAGRILRTHIMRPTWHFVTPADIRWMNELTASRMKAANAYMYRQQKLDEALFARSNAVIARALQGRQSLTRIELGAVLAGAGIAASGLRLLYIVHHAEVDGIVTSGPRRGKQFTYMLLDDRVPQARALPRDEALAELTLRYFSGHGPATMQDFAWWSGLTAADTRFGLELAGSRLAQEVIDGQPYWFSASNPPIAMPTQSAFLLPTYDELLVGYTAFDKSRTAGVELGEEVLFNSTIVIGDKIAGSWRRDFKQGMALIKLSPYSSLSVAESEAINQAARRYGEFFSVPVVIA